MDEIVDIREVPESWDVPASTHRVAYILDLTDTPELLRATTVTIDGLIKKQVLSFNSQDSGCVLTSQTVPRLFYGSNWIHNLKSLAKVAILDPAAPVHCRRSNLTCSGCYTCAQATDDFLSDCQRWDNTDEPDHLVSTLIMVAKASEATSVAAVASA